MKNTEYQDDIFLYNMLHNDDGLYNWKRHIFRKKNWKWRQCNRDWVREHFNNPGFMCEIFEYISFIYM